MGVAAVRLALWVPALVAAGCHGRDRAMFPAEVLGFRADGAVQRYGPDTLHKYIDGAAEVYLAQGVGEVRAQRYVGPANAEIIADVFDMVTPENAFGAYHHDDRDGAPAGVGQESEATETSVCFRKGRFFVSIIATDAGGAAGRAVAALARTVAGAIADEGRPPDLLQRLPREGLVASTIHYTRSHRLLNRYYFIADANLLDLGPHADAILAAYRPPAQEDGAGDRYQLLVAGYDAEAGARDATARFRQVYLRATGTADIVATENGKWTGIRARKNVVAAVFDAPSRLEAERALAAVFPE